MRRCERPGPVTTRACGLSDCWSGSCCPRCLPSPVRVRCRPRAESSSACVLLLRPRWVSSRAPSSATKLARSASDTTGAILPRCALAGRAASAGNGAAGLGAGSAAVSGGLAAVLGRCLCACGATAAAGRRGRFISRGDGVAAGAALGACRGGRSRGLALRCRSWIISPRRRCPRSTSIAALTPGMCVVSAGSVAGRPGRGLGRYSGRNGA